MGLSILIPVYNYNVYELADTISKQIISSGREAEILILDDGSSADFVSKLEECRQIKYVRYYRSDTNIGRMAARVKLSDLARHEYFLFIDADSELLSEDYLRKYFTETDKKTPLVSGGRVYSDKAPSDCSLRLHWKYGTLRENSLINRTAFMSNNFLVQKQLFKNLNHSIPMKGYGHEDSWWGIQFEQLGVRCKTIDNPVLHASLQSASEFLVKSKEALSNILFLESKTNKELLAKHIKIYRWYRKFKRTGLARAFVFFEKPFHLFFEKNLLSCRPNLFYFDCYRLANLLDMGNEKKEERVGG